MTLDEQLAMATSAVPMTPAQPAPTPVVEAPTQGTTIVQPQNVTTSAVATPVYNNTSTTLGGATAVTQTVTQAPTQMQPQFAGSIDLNQAAAEAEQHYGIQEITLGQTISTRAIDPVKKMDKGEKMRFTIIDPRVMAAKIHNHETLGKIACFSNDDATKGPIVYGQCCRDMDSPKVRYYMPILVYSTMPGDPRTPLPQGKSELRLLVIWDVTSYNKLCEEIMEAGNNAQIDFIATSEDSYGKLDFKGQQQSFRAMPEYQAALNAAIEKWNAVKDKAPLTVRRDMDAERYVKLTQVAVPPQMQVYSQDDILG